MIKEIQTVNEKIASRSKSLRNMFLTIEEILAVNFLYPVKVAPPGEVFVENSVHYNASAAIVRANYPVTQSGIPLFKEDLYKYLKNALDYENSFLGLYQQSQATQSAVRAENAMRKMEAMKQGRQLTNQEKVKNPSLFTFKEMARIPLATHVVPVDVALPAEDIWFLSVMMKPLVKRSKKAIRIKPIFLFKVIYLIVANGEVDADGMITSTNGCKILKFGSVSGKTITEVKNKFSKKYQAIVDLMKLEYERYEPHLRARKSQLGYKFLEIPLPREKADTMPAIN